MYPIDIPAIERQARELRAAEIQRINGLFAERIQLLMRLAAMSAFAGAQKKKSASWRRSSADSTTPRASSFPGTRRTVAAEGQAAKGAGDLTPISDG